jgi:teichuronic acid biosynthesis protein TuaE
VVAAIVGAAVGRADTIDAAGAVAAVLLGALIARRPAVTFGVCLLILCYSPEYLGPEAGVLGHPEVPKALIYFVALGMALHRGIRPRYLIVTGGYVALATLAWINGQLNPALNLNQVLSSFVTLSVGWTALAVSWDFRRDVAFLRVLCVLPVASVVVGGLLQVAGLDTLYRASRLQGASIPAQLALMCFTATIAGSLCYRLTRWRWAPFVVFADAVILGLTVSRGSAIALGLAMAWPTLRFAFGPSLPNQFLARRWMRVGAVAVAIAVVAAILIPALLARGNDGTYVVGEGFVKNGTSGRSKAWSEFLAIARKAPLFGHGLGAGPITKVQEQGFLAQHNEYLRLFLEGGYIGGGIVLLAIIVVIGMSIANAPPWVRLDLLGLAIGFAVLSYTDNTLSSPTIAVPFCLIFGIVGSWRQSVPLVPKREIDRARPQLQAA